MGPQLPEKVTLPNLIRNALAQPRAEVLLERAGGAWKATSSEHLLERVERVACAIRDAGLEAGDRVALVSHNCVNWIVADFGALFAGCVIVPIYPTQALDHLSYILEHSGARLIFADTLATYERLRDSGAALPRVVRFDSGDADGLQAFEARGEEVRAAHPGLPGAYEATLVPDDLAVLIYTSGTTGPPKGVMLSHDNLAFDATVSLACGFEGIEGGRDVMSVLPYSHIYEHTLIYIYLLAKVRYFICHDPGELLGDLRDVRPAEMTAVPRIFDRVMAGIKGQALRAGGLRGKLIPWSLEVAREYMTAQTFGRGASRWLALRYAFAERLVLHKVRAALGLDRVQFLTSGSAPLHVDTAMTLLGLGVPVMQGYGLTETSPVVSVSRLSDNEYGAVGRPITGVDVRIAEDGELMVRGRNVMHGYYRDPDATAEAIEDGWLHTGDIGEIDARGFLRITDRKGEIFKTSTGKWIAPARIEASIKRSIFVAQAMVTGRGQPHPIALVSPNWPLLRLELPTLPEVALERLAEREDVRTFLDREVRKQTHGLATYEQVRHVVVVPHEFTVEGGELSPSMKIKRRAVEARYAREIERAYRAESAALA
ncbi:MAG: long-chain fatty acid--CoA ligase [Candidatus Eremiobacteraeota bacterium]|nr:long-chain fatty acid--CoA ligase [Candidatus Eremiobacteraeota bacterium]MBV8499990.1 long-chain fatty acid--CoA ligase [Candidatus Eremiobacteraeota bacterium]